MPETVLLVDDEANVLQALTRLLRREEYNVLKGDAIPLGSRIIVVADYDDQQIYPREKPTVESNLDMRRERPVSIMCVGGRHYRCWPYCDTALEKS